MKKGYLLITIIVMLITSCQKNEESEISAPEVTVTTLEKDYGLKFTEKGEAEESGIHLSLEELKNVMENLKELDGKKFQLHFRKYPSTRGTAVMNPDWTVNLREEHVTLPNHDVIDLEIDYYTQEGFFNTRAYLWKDNIRQLVYSASNLTTIVHLIDKNNKVYTSLAGNVAFITYGSFGSTRVTFGYQMNWYQFSSTCETSISYRIN